LPAGRSRLASAATNSGVGRGEEPVVANLAGEGLGGDLVSVRIFVVVVDRAVAVVVGEHAGAGAGVRRARLGRELVVALLARHP